MSVSHNEEAKNTEQIPGQEMLCPNCVGRLTSNVELAKMFQECGLDPSRDFKCIQRVSTGAYVFVFRSLRKTERCQDLVDKFAFANMQFNDLS